MFSTLAVVRGRGFEPLRLAALDPKSSSSASSDTLACDIEAKEWWAMMDSNHRLPA
jgi:hypothetical protein